MKSLIYCLVVGICMLLACSAKKESFAVEREKVLVTQGVEKTREGYMKALAGNWKIDTASARYEMLLMTGTMADKVAKEKGDERLGPKWREFFAVMSDEWIGQMVNWTLELKEDGTRIVNEGAGPMKGKFDFNPALDSIYLMANNGAINYRFKLKTVSPDSLVYLRFMPLEDGDTSSYMRYKYIR